MVVNQKKRKEAQKQVEALINDSKNVFIIHYSCESLHNRPDGSSPKITSIVVRKLSNAQTHSFSIHTEAEIAGIPINKIEEKYPELEKSMLEKFYDFVDRNNDRCFVHWNMRDQSFGFGALDLRFRIHKGKPVRIDDNNKIDLARLLLDIYGAGYIEDPRLQKLIEKNQISNKNFLSGAAEAQAFIEKNYTALHHSNLRKVAIFAEIIQRVNDNTLKVNTKWLDLHGGIIHSFFGFFCSNKIISGILAIAALSGLIFGCYDKIIAWFK